MKDIRITPKQSASERDTSLVVFVLVVMLFLTYLFTHNEGLFGYQADIQEADVHSTLSPDR